ncbi:MAG: hypothetical protein L6R42_002196 [Xanthoria sp. 1 TBL-2021]|nr:MAG: hypothetical protein L6R42_002196 [Xanthoria sp. 1 TBL-2021]
MNNFADSTYHSCKGLVIWDREDGIVRFAHHTVQQFLLSDPNGAQESNLKCSDRAAGLYVGEMCLTYLLFSDFETQIQKIRTEQPLDVPQAGPAYWIPGMLGVRTSKLERPFRLLGLGSSSSAPDIDYAKHLRSACGVKPLAPSTKIVDKYSLLQYIIDHWVFHTKEFDPASSLSRKLQDLARYKILPFEFRPWGRNQHYGPYGCGSCNPGGTSSSETERLPFMSLFHYAAEAGHWSLMEPLAKDYCFHEIDNDNRQTFQWDAKAKHWLLAEPLINKLRSPEGTKDWTICIAIRNGHERIFERLLLHPDDGLLPIEIRIINAAASSGHEIMFRALLERLEPPKTKLHYANVYIREYAHITLALAAANGHQYIVEILFQQGVPVDEQVDMCGETPISAAAANGHDHVVRFLVANGARIWREGVTPLHRAAEYGHSTVARALLQLQDGRAVARTLLQLQDSRAKNEHLNVVHPPHLLGLLDREGEIPLHQAARNGHADVVQVMLELAPAAKQSWLLATTPVSSHKQTALHLAAANGHLAVVRLLRSYGNMADGNGEKPIVLAAKGNHVSVVEALVEGNRGVSDAVSALAQAVIKGHQEVVQILLDHYPLLVSLNLLFLAARYEHEVILELLIRTHRKGDMHLSYAESRKKFLYEAFKRARADKLQEAARLLESYWRQEL